MGEHDPQGDYNRRIEQSLYYTPDELFTILQNAHYWEIPTSLARWNAIWKPPNMPLNKRPTPTGTFIENKDPKKADYRLKSKDNLIFYAVVYPTTWKVEPAITPHTINAEQMCSKIQSGKIKSTSKIHKSTRNKSVQTINEHDKQSQKSRSTGKPILPANVIPRRLRRRRKQNNNGTMGRHRK
jgi:hypothetical protein